MLELHWLTVPESRGSSTIVALGAAVNCCHGGVLFRLGLSSNVSSAEASAFAKKKIKMTKRQTDAAIWPHKN